MKKGVHSSYPGIFIGIDGPNGVGKSTVIEHLINDLKIVFPDYECIKITEPSKSSIGVSIREFSEKQIHGNTLLHLVAADREFNHAEYIRPLLENKKVILITDRYFSSSLVYQRMHGLDIDTILTIHNNIYIPDILFILNGNIEIIKARLSNDRKSSQLFENAENVEIETQYFNDSVEILNGIDYNVSKVFNQDLLETVSILKKQIVEVILNKSN